MLLGLLSAWEGIRCAGSLRLGIPRSKFRTPQEYAVKPCYISAFNTLSALGCSAIVDSECFELILVYGSGELQKRIR
jgi:hypothetical protein